MYKPFWKSSNGYSLLTCEMDKNNATQHKEFIFTCESDLDPELMQPSKTLCLSCDCGEHKYP